MNLSSKRIRTLLIPLQIVVSILILYLLFRSVNLTDTIKIMVRVNIPTLMLSVVFFILSSLAIGFALHGALKSTGAAPPLHTTQLANFGGQLLGDITPAKSGYFATPVLLNQLRDVPIEKGLMSVMSVGAINFIIKAIFSTMALLYFIDRISLDPTMMNAMIIGITLLLSGGIGLTTLVWTDYFSTLLKKLSKLPLIGAIIKKLNSIRDTFAKDKAAMKKSAKTTIPLIIASVLLSTVALYIVAHAIGLTQPTFEDLLFMGPLTAVFMYVPVTFAGLGLQEAAYVFLLTNIGAPIDFALPFALIIRLMSVSTDLIGLPSLIKTSAGIFHRLNKGEPLTQEKQNLPLVE